ncbi:MAG TPA: NADH-quinone oxidoreductase subunit H, partial [Bellilinea sp.]|nr:NADH-quinone oxidoreductase subunit H [Bellilinea sp.]
MTFWKQPLSYLLNMILTWFRGLGLSESLTMVIEVVVGAFLMVMVTMLFVIFLIWYERKLIGRFQDRFGPNRLGPWGVFQPFADMLKIFTKEYITPQGADLFAYNLAPALMVGAVLMIWAAIPLSSAFAAANLSNGVLYLFAVSGFAAVAIILAGWGSNNKYSLLAGLRAVAQLVTFEVPHILTALIPVMFAGTLNLMDLSRSQTIWNAFLVPAAALLFLLTSLAEIGRAPFDLVEAESELIGG